MRREAFLEQLQERGEYGAPQAAERAARTVLLRLPPGYDLLFGRPEHT